MSSTPTTLFADGTYAYSMTGTSLVTIARTGGAAVHSVSVGSGAPTSLVVDTDGMAYWVSNYDEIKSVPVAGGTVTVVASESGFEQVVVDSEAIYWTTVNTVVKLAK